MGGVNKKEIAKGGDAMRKEVDRVLPLVEDGGYIPELDHSVPPDISWSMNIYCVALYLRSYSSMRSEHFWTVRSVLSG